jgi:hypothetical protein
MVMIAIAICSKMIQAVADGFCDGFVIQQHKISGINMFAHMRSKGAAMTGEMTPFR